MEENYVHEKSLFDLGNARSARPSVSGGATLKRLEKPHVVVQMSGA